MKNQFLLFALMLLGFSSASFGLPTVDTRESLSIRAGGYVAFTDKGMISINISRSPTRNDDDWYEITAEGAGQFSRQYVNVRTLTAGAYPLPNKTSGNYFYRNFEFANLQVENGNIIINWALGGLFAPIERHFELALRESDGQLVAFSSHLRIAKYSLSQALGSFHSGPWKFIDHDILISNPLWFDPQNGSACQAVVER